jgi:pimeloyl-ACP methyl ester carboxylesterase
MRVRAGNWRRLCQIASRESIMTVTRRSLLPADRKTFCLVHGTWHGGWVWQRVADRLRAMGHAVIAPTATGCGERAHLIGPEVGLATHVRDVAGAIEAEELADVILVGHSFGGLTITGVADLLGPRIRRIVFYDAFIPTRARPAWVMRDAGGNWPGWWLERQARFADGYKMDFFDFYPLDMLVPPEETANTALLRRRLTWHPALQWTEAVSFAHGGWEPLPRTYIHTTAQAFRPSSEAMWGPARGPGWDWTDIATPRGGMLTHPDLVAGVLAALT